MPAGGEHFPPSRWSLLHRIREAPPEGKRPLLDQLILLYYKPVYRFFQRVLDVRDERLKDVTQDFFTRFVEKDFLKNLHHEKSFRSFLKVACRRHYINWLDAERVRKAPGGRKIVSLEDGEIVPEAQMSQLLDEELRQGYIQRGVERLRETLTAEGKEAYFRVFEQRTRFEGGKPKEYAVIAKELGLSLFDVRNYLSVARKKFRGILVELASEATDDAKAELRDLGLAEYVDRKTS